MTDLSNLKTDTSPFTVRKPKLLPWHLGAIGFSVFIILLMAATAQHWLWQIAVMAIVSGAMVGLIYLIQNRSVDEKTATEFQALVFSGAMRSTTLFTVILYQDGSIFYLDPRYARNFEGSSAGHNLDQFLSTIEVPAAEKAHIYDSISKLDKAALEYSYQGTTLKISVSPLQRPEGFVNLSVSK